MVDKSNHREILSAALSAHVSELRLFWRETGFSCRWLVPDAEHCYVDEESLRHLDKFRQTVDSTIPNESVRQQWLDMSSPLLDGFDTSMPFPLRTLTWLLRVVESPHREDLTIDTWNLYLWSVRLSDLPNRILRKLSSHLESQSKQALIDFDTLAARFFAAVQNNYPKDFDRIRQREQMTLNHRFDRLRRFKNLIFYGIANIGKANISKQLIRHWQSMTGRPIGMHCVTVFHPNTSYSDMVERRVEKNYPASMQSPIEHRAPRVIANHIQEARYFFEPYAGENIQEGLLMSLCRAAAHNPDKDYVFMIDCIDQANLNDVLGEVAHMLDSFARVPWRIGSGDIPGAWDLEAEGARSIRLTLSGRIFFLPSNVYILGTATEDDLFSAKNNERILQAFVLEHLPAMDADQLKLVMLADRPHEDFARLEEYAEHSIALWHSINAVLIETAGRKNIIGYGPLFSMCEEILSSSDVHDANRIVLGTWRYRMLSPVIQKMNSLLLTGTQLHRQSLDKLIECLNQSWLRMTVTIEGIAPTECIGLTFEEDFSC
ncbi:MAG: hypothetical protein FWC40_05645 [Proteobacteria bacterium]|nr:hypothetical protein [Pseudomonadota bacterium]